MTYKNHTITKPTIPLPTTSVHEGYKPIACRTLFQRIDEATKSFLTSHGVESDYLKQRYQVLFIREKEMVCQWRPMYEKRTPSHDPLDDGQFVITANLKGGRRVGVPFLRKLSREMQDKASDKEVFLRRSKYPHALWLFLS